MVSWILSLLTVVHAQFVPFAYMAARPASIQFLAAVADGTDTQNYLFSNVNLGTEHADRYILIGVTSRSGANYVLSSVTVDGASATLVQSVSYNSTVAAFYIIAKPTGTAGDIRTNFSGGMVRASISVWQVRGLKSTTASATGNLNVGTNPSNSTTLTIPQQGIVAAVYFNTTTGTTPVPASWTGVRSDQEIFLLDTSINAQFSCGSYQTGIAQASRTISVSPSVAANAGGLVIALR